MTATRPHERASTSIPTIRRTTPEDEPAVRAILDEYNDAASVVLRDDCAAIRSYLFGPGAFWLAQDARVAGCIAFRPLPNIGPLACEVKRLYVRVEYRGTGLADALLDALEDHARAVGRTAIYLDTYAGLAAAVRFYARRGYVPVPRYNDNTQATIFMRRSLR